MQFTTRQFLLLPLVYLLITWLVGGFFAFRRGSFPWQHEIVRVRFAQERIESTLRFCAHQNFSPDDKAINDWLCKRLPSDHPAASILLDPPPLDSWGNPYQIQPRKTNNEKLRVYSTGEDGFSKTHGHDPDDIRSGDEHAVTWYSRRQFAREMAFCMIIAAMITPLCFWFVSLKAKPVLTSPNST